MDKKTLPTLCDIATYYRADEGIRDPSDEWWEEVPQETIYDWEDNPWMLGFLLQARDQLSIRSKRIDREMGKFARAVKSQERARSDWTVEVTFFDGLPLLRLVERLIEAHYEELDASNG